MEQYHYLGYEQPVGEHLKYLVWARGARPVAALAWSSSPRHLGARDRYIGWSQEARQRNLHLIAYNTRFLILPWVQVPHLASHILGRMAARISADWEARYAHPLYLLETFVDPERFRGTCYRGGELESAGGDDGTGQGRSHPPAEPFPQASAGAALAPAVSRVIGSGKPMKRRRIDVKLGELDQLLDRAREAPLSEPDCHKIKTTLHTLVEILTARRSTEKTSAVVDPGKNGAAAAQPAASPEKPANGHGRTPASAYTGATTVAVPHPDLKHGDTCPECLRGRVYVQKEPRALVRIVGQAPLAATVYHLEELRCNACGQVFTAPEPEGVGPEKYDETAAAMIAQLKYGSGAPFQRIENLEQRLGVPLPVATQWGIVEEAADLLTPALDELTRQAAQGELFHNDDTSVRILKMERPAGDERTGVFTSAVVSVVHDVTNLAGVYKISARFVVNPSC